MSCQQASRIITTQTTTTAAAARASSPLVVHEDPYVFTETLSNTPPILFNAQKLRSKQTLDTPLFSATTTTTTNVNSNTATTTTTTAAAATTSTSAVTTSTTTTALAVTTTNQQQQQPKVILNGKGLSKTQASVAASSPLAAAAKATPAATTTKTTTAAATNNNNTTLITITTTKATTKQPTNLKSVTQSQQTKEQTTTKQQQQQQGKNVNAQQQQQQQQQQRLSQQQHLSQPTQQQYQQLQKQLAQLQKQNNSSQQHPKQQQSPPPPLYTHTPSLWQTPLLLDTLPSSAVCASPPTSPASLPSPTAAATNTDFDGQNGQTTVVVGGAGAGDDGTLSPLLFSPTAAQPLPPSRFHHTTMAHHLQKVECLKKPLKRNNSSSNNNNNNITTMNNNNTQSNGNKLESPLNGDSLLSLSPPPLQSFQKHSADTDLNDIPVNVIFRKPPVVTTTTTTSPSSSVLSSSDDDRITTTTPPTSTPMECRQIVLENVLQKVQVLPVAQQQYTSLPLTPPSPTQLQPLFSPIPAQVELPLPQQQQQTQTTLTTLSPNSTVLATQQLKASSSAAAASGEFSCVLNQPQQQQHAMTSSSMQNITETELTHSNSSTIIPATSTSSSAELPHHTESEQPTTNNLLPPDSSTSSSSSPTQTSVAVGKHRKNAAKGNGNAPNAAQKKRKAATAVVYTQAQLDHCQGSTTAVGVMKMSGSADAADISTLSDPSCLPYIVQRNWLSVSSGAGGREERIAQHKNQLRRQALQLLATRSLQKLPLQLAFRRLGNVAQLLRKHKNHSDAENQPLKQCLVAGCDNPVLVMASHCLQHITHNQTQQIFMSCFAKNADNVQCNAPVFETQYDRAFCQAHAKQKEDYKRQYAEQQKLNSNKLALVTTSTTSPLPPSSTIVEQLPQRPQLHQHNYLGFVQNKKIEVTKVLTTTNGGRKRKNNTNAINMPINNNNLSLKKNVGALPVQNVVVVGNGNLAKPQKRAKKATASAAVAVAMTPTMTQATMAQHNSNTNQASAMQNAGLNSFLTSASSITSATNSTLTSLTSPPPLSAVLQRKGSTTSLESITSNSHSSCSQSTMMTHMQQQQQQQQSPPLHHLQPLQQYVNTDLPPPALAPLSNHHHHSSTTRFINFTTTTSGNLSSANVVAADLKAHEIDQIVAQLNMGPYNNNNCIISNNNLNNSNSNLNSIHYMKGTLNGLQQQQQQQFSFNAGGIVTQHNNNNNNSNHSTNSNSSSFYLNANSNSSIATTTYNGNNHNNNQFTSVLPTSTEELLGHHQHHHLPHQQQQIQLQQQQPPQPLQQHPLHQTLNSHHLQNLNLNLNQHNNLSQSSFILSNHHSHHQSSLHNSTLNLNQHHHLHQYNQSHLSSNHNDMLSICDNSSAYASSEDTGLGGGLSESELMAGAHDVDEIPLGDTRLLEEHDLANVLSGLPEDEFNELFTAVRQDECEEVERALELADQNLKTLQQSIGSESDFLSDIFDVNDDMLADTADICSNMEIVSSVMHSPDTSGIDTSALFIDSSGSNSIGGLLGGGSSSSNGTGNGCAGVTDIRGLVQT